MEKRPVWVYVVSLVVFLGFILIAYIIDVKDYVNDSITMIVLLTILFMGYNSLKLKPWVYLTIAFAFAFHNLGVFGFYNISPIFLQWDHVTHLVGEFAAGVFVYNYVYVSGFFKNKSKIDVFNLVCLCILAGIGFGVFVEFMEFFGYFFVGDGLGIFGHGEGDIATEFIDSEWFNTMFDLIYNAVGATLGVLFYRYGLKKKS